MKKFNICTAIIISIFMITIPALAGDFDGSKPLLCAVIDIVECGSGGKCQQLTAEDVGIPRFLKVNFKKKTITATQASGNKKSTTIKNSEHIDGKLILQGAEDGIEGVRDGVGWSIAIAGSV